MWEALQFEFMRNALMAGIFASITCGVIGTLVVVNRIVFLAGGIAHAAYGGIGLAFFLGWPYMYGTFGFSLLSAMVMAAVTLRDRHRSDTVIGVLWAVGMATGVIFLDLTPGYNVDLMSYLFGSILSVPGSDLRTMLIMCAAVIVLVSCFYNELMAMSYDAEFAKLRGVPVTFFYFLLLGMIAVSVVMVIQVVGLILVIAMLTIPPYIAEKFSGSLFGMMLISSLLSCLFTTTGLWVSYTYNLTSGATVIMVNGAAFFISVLVERLRPSPLRG
ncbi:metal ABC transporter permease [Desulfonema ishimotonii]|uniref:Metal ABC transporter permease n=1 Tax=Desulfonema ishimotonii TaxID=45657 RepID=A0A401FVM7_9BACT|nr:metal ABC transporter permease [Desulfonema ishimotonii]GBC61032.1 metal ABC transporter permease [Desulfonema ishimotonii]